MSELLRMENIRKVYPNGVVANKDVNLRVNKGEIHALMGENGAGKSTLMKILFGLEQPDEGEIYFKGDRLQVSNPAQAIQKGIGMVNQHFMLVDNLSVYENVILGMEPRSGVFINRTQAIKLVEEYAEKFNLRITPTDIVENLSVSQKQKIELLKVLTRGSELIILDEPTAVLTPQETDELFQQLTLLKESGYTIVFITHKIQEVLAICDQITVLKKGKTVETLPVKGATAEGISKLMVGRDVLLRVEKEPKVPGEHLLKVKDITVYNESGVRVVDKVSLSLKRNQIIGIAGVEGNGQSELADAIFGIMTVSSGTVDLKGENLTRETIGSRRNKGLAYIPEDRIVTGSATSLSIWENLFADKIEEKKKGKLGLINLREMKNAASDLIKLFNIVSMNQEQTLDMLSGGNMQKVVVARELSANPEVLLANQPTRGIDVGAQEFIWQELVKFRDSGKGVILISADLNELLELSDIVLVMHKGKVVAQLDNTQKISEDEVGLYMLGVKTQGKEGEHYES
ncbi:ABC transporter ATP-binding protein [Proteiniclasticum sp. BAD-10]|uniref:ABC transporter ATP-binding protein n=1 Tax=Proteiniclasticum sediminis TaxID=2804028 RepID=A0A941CNA6_9CLOT|nr:ABC transporter ATP-binding protein [Proteiniclasticum sediminis]MBR0575034.1 ABC transporter ATP-binding protein [Proteiniclasticum sediminis]